MIATKCFEDGANAEIRFAETLDSPSFASEYEDINEHWDVCSGDGTKYDVKTMKRWKRSDAEKTDRIHFVELRNVRGNLGWVYGEADFIVFETRSYWLVVPRQTLAAFVEMKTQHGQFSQRPEAYRLYQRNGRSDVITLVPTVDLLALAKEVIKK